MAKAKDIQKDISAEVKIKEAARKLFTEKGFEATKTREIAEAAGINLALLNYYFRSKQKLYEIIMDENMASFKKGIADLFGNTELEVFEKVEKLANFYIDEFIANRDLPLFIITTIYNKNSSTLIDSDDNISDSRKVFVNQIKDLVAKRKIKPIHPAHIISNLIGLVLFPFLISPMLKVRAQINDKEFVALMNERKTLIPIWVKSMLEN
jgi:AcrR family transcriptional regulator